MRATPAARVLESRDYQTEIINAAAKVLADGGIGQIRMACGSGKTFVGEQIGERLLGPGEVAAVLVPSLSLAAQTMKTWLTLFGDELEVVAVCGDEKIADSVGSTKDLKVPVTTSPIGLAGLLATPCTGIRLVLCTNASAPVLAEAVRTTGPLDLLIVDEAHHLAGRVDTTTRAILDPAYLPARRRLFMTATPRLNLSHRGAELLVGMDDESVFGPVLGTYPFGRGIAEGYLSDYRVVVICVRDSEARQLLAERGVTYVEQDDGPSLELAVAQVALARAREQYGIRKVLSFHPLVKHAETFARTLPSTLAMVAPEQSYGVYAAHVHGEMDQDTREQYLRPLATKQYTWAVVSSARCLSEGVDLPAVDAVLFTAIKRSAVDITQAVGRAMRLDSESPGPSLIILPHMVHDGQEPGDDPADEDLGDFETLVHVVRALRAHDDELAADLDTRRRFVADRDLSAPVARRELPAKITVQLPVGMSEKFLSAVSLKLLDGSTLPWWEGYNAAKDYAAEHKHLLVPKSYVNAEGFPTGKWVGQQRSPRSRGYSDPKYRALLDEIGMVWDVRLVRHAEKLESAKVFHAEHGHLRVPVGCFDAHGNDLGSWLRECMKARGKSLPEAIEQGLDVLGIVWSPAEAAWEAGFQSVLAFKDEFGHTRISAEYVNADGLKPGAWLNEQLRAHRGKRLAEPRRVKLTTLGLALEPVEETTPRKSRDRLADTAEDWERYFPAAVEYHAERGDLEVPNGRIGTGGVNLGNWIYDLRAIAQGKRPGVIRFEHKKALDGLGMRWTSQQVHKKQKTAAKPRVRTTPGWERSYPAALAYHAEHGDLDVPHGYVTEDGLKLGVWVYYLRAISQGKEYGVVLPEHRALLDALGMRWEPKIKERGSSSAPLTGPASPPPPPEIETQGHGADIGGGPVRESEAGSDAPVAWPPVTAVEDPRPAVPPAPTSTQAVTGLLFLPPQQSPTHDSLSDEDLQKAGEAW